MSTEDNKAIVLRLMVELFNNRFDPWHGTIEDIIAQGDKVAVRLTETCTMTGSFMGMPPTGKSFTLDAVQICHLVDGKRAEMWRFRDKRLSDAAVGSGPLTGPVACRLHHMENKEIQTYE